MSSDQSIVHFGSHLGGGANRAGMRLHDAQRGQGLRSTFFYGLGSPPDESYQTFFPNKSFLWRNAAALATSWRSRQDMSGGFVTSPSWIRVTPIQSIGFEPQVVNLHWVAKWLDMPSFLKSLPKGTPVVWTLHDFIPVTGGCHYPGTCDGFTKHCGNCPQLKHRGPLDATRRFFKLKEKIYSNANLHFVGNSSWTTKQAQRSGLLAHAKSITTINLGLNVTDYSPIDKTLAKRALGIPENKFIIGFSCLDFKERRKGAEILMKALETFPSHDIALVVLGAGKWPQSNFETIAIGSLGTPRLQSLYYSALDVFAMPSMVETFGLVAMEAMACESPVVAYAAGGLTDVVVDHETGLLEKEIGSLAGLTQMLQWMWKHPTERMAMGKAGRERVVSQLSDTLMAQRYSNLYEQILSNSR